jgi:hypothetical protein
LKHNDDVNEAAKVDKKKYDVDQGFFKQLAKKRWYQKATSWLVGTKSMGREKQIDCQYGKSAEDLSYWDFAIRRYPVQIKFPRRDRNETATFITSNIAEQLSSHNAQEFFYFPHKNVINWRSSSYPYKYPTNERHFQKTAASC